VSENFDRLKHEGALTVEGSFARLFW